MGSPIFYATQALVEGGQHLHELRLASSGGQLVGRQVLTAPADAAGTAVLALPTGLATGVYVVRTGSQALRLTVE